MISVIIPTLNAEATLAATLTALVPAAVAGLVTEVIIVDGGSTDRTARIAEEAGAKTVTSEPGRGGQLAAGAKAAKSPWLLFLHADTVLSGEFVPECYAHCHKTSEDVPEAAVFQLKFDDTRLAARLLEMGVWLRTKFLGLPYGDQGLLISAAAYRDLGGFKQLPLMEDVDFIRRIGRGKVTMLRTVALTSASRYQRDGYLARIGRNLICLSLYFGGMSPARIAKIYG